MGIKLFLDDIRNPPNNTWVTVRRLKDAKLILAHCLVDEISFDHDLGEFHNGYDLMVWLEEQVYNGSIRPPKVYVHTANDGARIKMEQCADKINSFKMEDSKGNSPWPKS